MMETNSGSMHNSFGELLSLVRTAELSGRQDVLKRHRNILLQQITDLATSIIDATDRVLPSDTEERMSRHVDPNEPGPLSAISAFRDACPLSNRLDCFSNNRRTIKNSQTMILSSNNPEASSYMRTPIGARKPTHVEEIELTEEDILATLAHRRKQQQPCHEIFQLETTEVESRDGLAPRRVPSCCFTQTFFTSDSVKDEAGMREPNESLPNYGAGGDYYMTPSADGLGTPVAVSVRPLENISMVSKCISKNESVLSTISVPNEADIAQINPSHIIHKNNVVLNFESTVPLLDPMYAENKTEENTRKPIKTTVNSEEGRIVLQHVIASDRRIHTMIFREPPMSHGSSNLDEVKDISPPMEVEIKFTASHNDCTR